MKFYKRTKEDKINGINHCFFNAKHGKISLAFERLRDLHDEFPEDVQIIYAEGILRKDFLGQGIKARELFEKAYILDNTQTFAACCATVFARDEQEFRKWAVIAQKIAPQNLELKNLVTARVRDLDKVIPYWEGLREESRHHFESRNYGTAAALMELVMLSNEMSLVVEVNTRRMRAESLRKLDEMEQKYRETVGEILPPEERLSLHEALVELEKAIFVDKSDAELWNLKSAWCYLLGRYNDTILFADKAIELRPFNYPKPYQNKAIAYWAMGKDTEALAYAKEALKQAENCGSISDIEQMRELVKLYSTPRRNITLVDIQQLIQQILNSALITSDQEIAHWQCSIKELAKEFFERVRHFRKESTMIFVPNIADLLSKYTSETSWRVILEIANYDQKVYDHCLVATLFVVTNSEGILQRDAARFLVLIIFGALDGGNIQSVYRQAILETSAAATGKMAYLDAILRKELERINPLFPKLIADQEPIDKEGCQRAMENILSRLDDIF